jgi:D-psicose/D-tagatose/L-ribulose 3-epimerase
MKYGIYYAYWEHQWGGDYLKYARKVGALGFDILEISCASLEDMPSYKVKELAQVAKDAGITLTGGYGPRPEENLSSFDIKTVENGFEFWKKTFDVLAALKIKLVGGGLYSYWPVDFSKTFNKEDDLKRSIESMKKLSEIAAPYAITLGMEALNRFEGYLINTAKEALDYVKAVDRDNVKVMLDTFHMNIEEDSLINAILTTGPYLGHFHIGEANRRPPGPNSRMDWTGIARALFAVSYSGPVVMEPFVLMGGQVGMDIKIWRELLQKVEEKDLDAAVADSLRFIRQIFDSSL